MKQTLDERPAFELSSISDLQIESLSGHELCCFNSYALSHTAYKLVCFHEKFCPISEPESYTNSVNQIWGCSKLPLFRALMSVTDEFWHRRGHSLSSAFDEDSSDRTPP